MDQSDQDILENALHTYVANEMKKSATARKNGKMWEAKEHRETADKAKDLLRRLDSLVELVEIDDPDVDEVYQGKLAASQDGTVMVLSGEAIGDSFRKGSDIPAPQTRPKDSNLMGVLEEFQPHVHR